MILIKNGKLVCPNEIIQTDLLIEGEKIAQIGKVQGDFNGEVIDAEGCYVFPGFIDAHTHLDMDNGVTVTADDFASGTKAAVSGGTTTVIDFATQDKGGTLQQAYQKWRAKAEGRSSCDFGFHMAICQWNPEIKNELSLMAELGITSFKVYMAYKSLFVNDREIMEILSTVKEIGGVLGVHCENGQLIEKLSADLISAGERSPAAHKKSRPPELEAEAVNRLLYISKLVGWPVNIVHLSSYLALEEVRKARQNGQVVFVESCPQYLLLDESRYELPDFESAKYVISPPLRSSKDKHSLIEAMVQNEIDTIATDHCSYNFKTQKSLGKDDFTKIPNGAPGIEHRPALIYSSFVKNKTLDIQQMNKLLSENPAKLFGLFPQKGALVQGADADIVIWNPEAKSVIRADSQLQNTDYTPYEGQEVFGRAEKVFLRGRCVSEKGKVILENTGEYVKRKRNDKL